MIFSIIIMISCILFLVLFSFMQSGKNKKEESIKLVSAQDFINVLEINRNILYTADNKCIAFIRLQPPMSSLWSRREKRMKTNTLVAEISKDREPWVLSAVSRPMDITYLVNQYKHMREQTDNVIRKNLLKQEMMELQDKVGSGQAVERQFYIKIWAENKPGADENLLTRAQQIINAYESIGVTGTLLKKQDIIPYCNLVHNPSYINLDTTDTTPGIPMIMDEEDAI
ncbi:MAG: hypothetical protein ACI4F4_06005 [Lachnospiraceae bacterium]